MFSYKPFVLCVWMLLGGCARTYLDIVPEPIRDASFEELRQLYQSKQEAFPPLLGLMEVTLGKKARFWAKWKSNGEEVQIKGFDLWGGPLFNFETEGTETVHFTTDDAGGVFHGSREAFQEYIRTRANRATKHSFRMEGLTLLDWVARGGTPDLSLSYVTALEKQKDRFILYQFRKEGDKTLLAQKLFIERKAFHVTEADLFDSDGYLEARLFLSDYRRLGADGVFCPFQIQMEAGDFYGTVIFKELRVDVAE